MKRIEGVREGQNDHMVLGVVVALHMSMLKSCIWFEGTGQLENDETNTEASNQQWCC